MGKRITGPLPAEVSQLQERVEAWRRARKHGAPTPSELWEAATALAMQFGVCRIGRAVGLDYTSCYDPPFPGVFCPGLLRAA